MVGDVEWDNVNLAGAFILGAVLATIGTIRVVRAVTTLFQDAPLRRRRRLPGEPDQSGTDTPDE